MGACSQELCGGTHVAHAPQTGTVVLTSESSVGAGMRKQGAVDVGGVGLRGRGSAWLPAARSSWTSPGRCSWRAGSPRARWHGGATT
ncbi:hypothetical protein [Actinospica acidiphila]|uniref:hypothetical protein n=1 Tax=Actinospica acidiphila TaxID=304899 RepID=UPI003DA8BE0D